MTSPYITESGYNLLFIGFMFSVILLGLVCYFTDNFKSYQNLREFLIALIILVSLSIGISVNIRLNESLLNKINELTKIVNEIRTINDV